MFMCACFVCVSVCAGVRAHVCVSLNMYVCLCVTVCVQFSVVVHRSLTEWDSAK